MPDKFDIDWPFQIELYNKLGGCLSTVLVRNREELDRAIAEMIAIPNDGDTIVFRKPKE